MKLLTLIALLIAGQVQADMQVGPATPRPVPTYRNIYGVTEASGLPRLQQHLGNAQSQLANIDGALKTVTMGAVNITPISGAASEAVNVTSQGLIQIFKTEGAIQSLPNHLFNLGHIPGEQ
jgi:hypothetical protein